MRHWESVVRAVAAVIATAVISWAVGLAAYRVALLAWFGETPSPGDWRAVVGWSAIVCTMGLLPLWAITLALRLRLEGRWRLTVAPLVVALAAIAAGLLLLGTAWGSRAVFSPEMLLYALLFASSGASFALVLELLMGSAERNAPGHQH